MASRLSLSLPAALIAIGLAASGCGDGVASDSTATTTPAQIVTPDTARAAPCDSTTLAQAANSAARRTDALLVQSVCRDGWLVELVSAQGPDAGLSTFVFVSSAGGWRLLPRSHVCFPPSPLPKPLFNLACNVN